MQAEEEAAVEGHASAAARRAELDLGLAEALTQSERAGEALRSHSVHGVAAAAYEAAAHASALRKDLTSSSTALSQAASHAKKVTSTGGSSVSAI